MAKKQPLQLHHWFQFAIMLHCWHWSQKYSQSRLNLHSFPPKRLIFLPTWRCGASILRYDCRNTGIAASIDAPETPHRAPYLWMSHYVHVAQILPNLCIFAHHVQAVRLNKFVPARQVRAALFYNSDCAIGTKTHWQYLQPWHRWQTSILLPRWIYAAHAPVARHSCLFHAPHNHSIETASPCSHYPNSSFPCLENKTGTVSHWTLTTSQLG